MAIRSLSSIAMRACAAVDLVLLSLAVPGNSSKKKRGGAETSDSAADAAGSGDCGRAHRALQPGHLTDVTLQTSVRQAVVDGRIAFSRRS